MRGKLARDLTDTSEGCVEDYSRLIMEYVIDGDWRTGPMVVGARSSGRMRIFTSMTNGGSSALREQGDRVRSYGGSPTRFHDRSCEINTLLNEMMSLHLEKKLARCGAKASAGRSEARLRSTSRAQKATSLCGDRETRHSGGRTSRGSSSGGSIL